MRRDPEYTNHPIPSKEKKNKGIRRVRCRGPERGVTLQSRQGCGGAQSAACLRAGENHDGGQVDGQVGREVRESREGHNPVLRKFLRPWLVLVVVLVGGLVGAYWWFFLEGRVSTDDAYV